jgi:hypothetical protein
VSDDWGGTWSKVIEAVKTVRDVMAPTPLAVVDASMSIDEASRVM